MYGKQHLSNIANRGRMRDDAVTNTSFDESSLDATDPGATSAIQSSSLSMEKVMLNVVAENMSKFKLWNPTRIKWAKEKCMRRCLFYRTGESFQ